MLTEAAQQIIEERACTALNTARNNQAIAEQALAVVNQTPNGTSLSETLIGTRTITRYQTTRKTYVGVAVFQL